MRNAKYYRRMVTHRTAVRELMLIAEELMPYGTCSLASGSTHPADYDYGVRRMIGEIKALKREVAEYRTLTKSLRTALKTPFNNL